MCSLLLKFQPDSRVWNVFSGLIDEDILRDYLFNLKSNILKCFVDLFETKDHLKRFRSQSEAEEDTRTSDFKTELLQYVMPRCAFPLTRKNRDVAADIRERVDLLPAEQVQPRHGPKANTEQL